MPAYEYWCNDCQRDFMIFLSIREFEDKPEIKCPHCDGHNVKRKYTGFFAKTDKKS